MNNGLKILGYLAFPFIYFGSAISGYNSGKEASLSNAIGQAILMSASSAGFFWYYSKTHTLGKAWGLAFVWPALLFWKLLKLLISPFKAFGSAFGAGYRKGHGKPSMPSQPAQRSENPSSNKREVDASKDETLAKSPTQEQAIPSTPKKPLFQADSVVGVSGAAVTWYQDGMMKYRTKCEKCGAIGDETYTRAPIKYERVDTYKRCNKCGQDFNVRIEPVCSD